MSIFKQVNSLVSTELQHFARALPKIVSDKGEIQFNALIGFLRESLRKFERLKISNTEYLVFKLSDQPHDVYIVSPDKPEDLETFKAKVKFIEEVFPRIRNTELFFRDGERIISFFYHKSDEISCNTQLLLRTNYQNLISYEINERDLWKRFTDALVAQTGIEKSAHAVEAGFCHEVTRKKKLFRESTIDHWNVVKNKKNKLEDLGEEHYDFPWPITLLILFLKWLVFHDTAVFFYPMPRPDTEHSGQGGIVWGVKFHDKWDPEVLWSIETYAFLLCSFVDKIIQVQHHRIARQASLRSAVAAIMARNWAHIFTSQVLVRFKGAGRESTIPNELLDYIITRSEYIADVTGEIPLLWGEGFLECQETGGREKSGILEEFRRTSILKKLEEAAGSKISSILIQSEGLCERIGFPFGAAVGRHAIFAILENYIRNVSKYGVLRTTKTNTLVIELSKREDDGAFITVKLSSNSRIGKRTEWEERASGIGRHISEPVIDQTGALPPSGWGLREMKIHACLVAGEDISALLAEGQPHFFQFDEQAAKQRGEYTFYFKVRRYQPVLKFDSKNKNKLNEFLRNPMKFPLCDFVVLQRNQANSYNERTWATFPSRVAIAGTAKEKSWLTHRVIFLNPVPTDENALISRLWEKFSNLLLARGARAYKIVIVDNGQPIRLGQSQQGDTIVIYHGDDKSRGAAMKISRDHILFSHQKLMMIWINEVHQKKKEVHQRKRKQETHPDYVVNDPVIIFKWKTLLGAKVLLIDTRLYEQYNRLDSEAQAQEQLKNLLGVYVIPETEEIGQNLKIKSCNMCLNEFQFVSVHYGYLQENPNTPLLKKNKLASFPPFVFMHTARGKIEAEFVEKYYWFRKIVSVGSLISAFNEALPLEIKMRLMAVFLSPQQGGKAL